MQGYYSVYGGATSQYPVYGTAASGVLSSAAAAFYPYMNFGEGSGNGYPVSQGYGVQYPHHLFPYSAAAGAGYPIQHYGTPISHAPSSALHSGLFINVLFSLITFYFFEFLFFIPHVCISENSLILNILLMSFL